MATRPRKPTPDGLPAPRPLDRGGRIVGLDPGANVGLVAFDVGPDLGVSSMRWLGSTVVHASASKFLTDAEQDGTVVERVAAWVADVAPGATFAVLEEPFDAQTSWRGYTKQTKGTAFRVGALYGLGLAGLLRAGIRHCHSYPVTTVKQQKRIGWMQGHGRLPDKNMVTAIVTGTLRALRVDPSSLSEHEQAALGVALFHLTMELEARQQLKIDAVRAGLPYADVQRLQERYRRDAPTASDAAD